MTKTLAKIKNKGGRPRASASELERRKSWRAAGRRREEAIKLDAKKQKSRAPAIRVPVPGKLEELIKTVPGFDPYADAEDCHFDPKLAQKKLDFFEKKLVLVRGQFAGQPFVLAPHQQAEVANLFGWVRKDGTRRFREAYISEARKNGKSTRIAGITVAELAEPTEVGSEIYSAASQTKQARLVFKPAAAMIQKSPWLKARLRVWKHSIENLADPLTVYVPVTAEAHSAHGFEPQLVVLDELHLQPDRDLYEALKGGMAARRQPMFINITTAGHDRESICYEIYGHGKAIMDYSKGADRVRDPEFFPAIYELGEHEDWTDQSLWHKANPNLDRSVLLSFLQSEFRKARASREKENGFRNWHLNQWVQQAVRWLNMADWDLCKCTDPPPKGAKCFAGLDLGIRRDLTAFVRVFRAGQKYIVRPHFWIPSEDLEGRIKRDHVPYDRWAAAGLVTITTGRTTDYEQVRADINAFNKQHGIAGIGYDPANCDQLAKYLSEQDGFTMELIQQGFRQMSDPAKFLEKIVLECDLVHDGNPVLRSHAEHASIEVHRTGLIFPAKDPKKSTGRIDGMVALVMALKLASLDTDKGSVYDRRGVRFA
jgi:phage terminase large subunit-like protein